MQPTVENLCNLLARHHLLEIDLIKNLRGRWRAEGGARADSVAEFRKWLTQNSSLTDFQFEMLDRGFADFLHFGEYNLIERIGNGRMAGIYKALHPLGQVVAIKVLPPGKAKHANVLARFQREARLAVQLDHDNCVRTFQHAQTKEGMHYLVMEFLEGQTLEEVLKSRGKLPAREVVAILAQALQGMDHLHDLGMVHRDIKPGNVMLVPNEAADLQKSAANCTVKVLDIGLGKALFDEGAGDEEGELTSEGTLLGTLDYMAPEQARNAASADIRADLYSLGCVAYEMLAGQPPFGDTNFVNQMRRHAEEKPKSIVEQVSGTPPGLEAIVLRLMAKDPALRFSTPGQVLKELKAIEKSVAPPPPPPPPKPLQSYLSWLETQRQQENGEAKPAPADTALPAMPIPAPLPTRNTAIPPLGPPPGAPPTAVRPLPVPQSPSSSPAPVPPTATTGSDALAFDPAPAAAHRSASKGDFKNFLATPRDWAAFGVGGAVVLLVVLVYALIRMVAG